MRGTMSLHDTHAVCLSWLHEIVTTLRSHRSYMYWYKWPSRHNIWFQYCLLKYHRKPQRLVIVLAYPGNQTDISLLILQDFLVSLHISSPCYAVCDVVNYAKCYGLWQSRGIKTLVMSCVSRHWKSAWPIVFRQMPLPNLLLFSTRLRRLMDLLWTWPLNLNIFSLSPETQSTRPWNTSH